MTTYTFSVDSWVYTSGGWISGGIRDRVFTVPDGTADITYYYSGVTPGTATNISTSDFFSPSGTQFEQAQRVFWGNGNVTDVLTVSDGGFWSFLTLAGDTLPSLASNDNVSAFFSSVTVFSSAAHQIPAGPYGPGSPIDFSSFIGNSYLNNDIEDFGASSSGVVFDAGVGNDWVAGSNFGDNLSGGIGNDLLTGGIGNDSLDGGDGNDSIDGGIGNDSIAGGIGNDLLYGMSGDNNLTGGKGDDSLYGDTGNDRLMGSKGADLLIGSDGRDVLIGGQGGDTLSGGAGKDRLTGGLGKDVFLFNELRPSQEADTVDDFSSGEDKLNFVRSAFAGIAADLVGKLRPAEFTLGDVATTTAHRFAYDSTTGNLWYDEDGTGAVGPVLVSTLTPGTMLLSSDIFLL